MWCASLYWERKAASREAWGIHCCNRAASCGNSGSPEGYHAVDDVGKPCFLFSSVFCCCQILIFLCWHFRIRKVVQNEPSDKPVSIEGTKRAYDALCPSGEWAFIAVSILCFSFFVSFSPPNVSFSNLFLVCWNIVAWSGHGNDLRSNTWVAHNFYA